MTPCCFNTLKLTGKIKGDSQAYEPGRIWLKVKSRNARDVVCAAVIGPMAQPRAVVVGLPMAGRSRIVGRSSPLSARAGRDVARYLHSPRGNIRGRRKSATGCWTGLTRKAARCG